MRHIPDWTGVRFKKDAKRFRKTMEMLRDGAYEDVKAQVVSYTLYKILRIHLFIYAEERYS